jgi:thiamine-phosphate pyrophosphorylase
LNSGAPALYVITDRHATEGRPLLAVLERALEGAARAGMGPGAVAVQLREKDLEACTLLELARPLRALTARFGAALYVNDRVDVALAAGADGVHLGQEDLPLAAARPLVPAGFIIGVSTHDEEQARAAAAAGADYIGFGPCFATRSKRNPDPVVGVERLARVCRDVRIPVVAIGGITLDTVRAVAAAGAAAAAVIAAVNRSADPIAAARAVVAAFA